MSKKTKFMPVPQEEEWGCGAACLASLLAIDYWEAIRRLGKKANDRPMGFSGSQLAQALGKGYSSRRTPLGGQKPDKLPIGTILFFSRQGRYEDGGHYMLRTPSGWMDPWFNKPHQPRSARIRRMLPSNAFPSSVLLPNAK